MKLPVSSTVRGPSAVPLATVIASVASPASPVIVAGARVISRGVSVGAAAIG